MMRHDHLFAFESDFVATLRCVPMAVRYKLDLAGVKLSLRQWSRFTAEDRRGCLTEPCSSPEEVEAYRARLVELVSLRTGEAATPAPADSAVALCQSPAVPGQVAAFARAAPAPIPADGDWRALAPLQRFVLLKLSRDNHDNVNFIPALREFGLYGDGGGALRASA